MTNTIKKVTLASLATLALAGAFTVAHTPTVLANTQIGNITVSNADDKDLTQKITKLKEEIKNKIQEKRDNISRDFQKVTERLNENGGTVDNLVGNFDDNFVMSIDGLKNLGFSEQHKLLSDNHLEKHLTGDYSKYLKDLSDYYECVKVYFDIDEEVMDTEAFEYYLADTTDILPQQGERYTKVLAKLNGTYIYDDTMN
ncbi:hypothetical protein [Streptococcus phocae]|uniref:Uncharacterized protein n=1 Tax=Streptococcus phocae TaxID=119224 RepID=A0A0N8FX44_9STRE|nr:hypothetical protein [Streptococcus phocae]KPJ22099.1 hypothetical protein AKK44_06265 [Streptococcus phocae]